MSLHIPVLREEVLNQLRIQKEGIYVDCTFGRGGHSKAILSELGDNGRLIAIDRDPEAIEAAQRELGSDQRFHIEQGPFTMLATLAEKLGVEAKINGIVFDLGVSSPQLENPKRGFSFLHQGSLDMRMDPGAGISAAAWLATASDREIARVIREYGEERYAQVIARAIVEVRQQAPLETTAQLARLVERVKPVHERAIHPATRCFQAIRIFINDETNQLKTALVQAVNMLRPRGRLLVISFHSLEHRIVKRFFTEQARGDPHPPELPVRQPQINPRLRLVGRPIRPQPLEIRSNPRARSATLRVAEKLP
ncbi:MAG: 16S rRNA (cytosine(1402)-N(4))-methyltransferase RsmH [Gammaproteobacteria bacterium]